MAIMKMLLGTYWLFVAWNIVMPFNAPMNMILLISALVLLGVHTLQLVFFSGVILRGSNSVVHNVVMVLLFGVTHLHTLRKIEVATPSDLPE